MASSWLITYSDRLMPYNKHIMIVRPSIGTWMIRFEKYCYSGTENCKNISCFLRVRNSSIIPSSTFTLIILHQLFRPLAFRRARSWQILSRAQRLHRSAWPIPWWVRWWRPPPWVAGCPGGGSHPPTGRGTWSRRWGSRRPRSSLSPCRPGTIGKPRGFFTEMNQHQPTSKLNSSATRFSTTN